MNIETKRELASELQKYMSGLKLSQIEFIRSYDFPKAMVQSILKKDTDFKYRSGKYGKIDLPSYFFYKIADLTGYKFDTKFWKIQVTPQTNNTLAYLKDAKENFYTNIIIGETGCGKSFSCKLFAKKHIGEVFIITVGREDNLSDLLNKIIDTTHLKTTVGTKGAKLSSIIKHLKKFKENNLKPMIIFDESEYLKASALSAVKEFYDNLMDYCSIVLVGTEQLIKNIETLKKRNKEGIPQFYRRIKFGIKYLPMIDTSYQMFLDEIECSELKKFLKIHCENYGELHDVLVPARKEAERLKEPLSLSFVRRVLNLSNAQYPI